MAEVIELYDQFVKGKKTRKGRWLPNDEKPAPEPVVTLVVTGAIDDFLGTRRYADRLAHLRRLRDDGLLIHDSDRRLTQRVRGQGVRRAYVFRAQAQDVPRAEPAPRPGRKVGSVGRVRIL